MPLLPPKVALELHKNEKAVNVVILMNVLRGIRFLEGSGDDCVLMLKLLLLLPLDEDWDDSDCFLIDMGWTLLNLSNSKLLYSDFHNFLG